MFDRKPVKSVKDGRYVIRLRSSTDEPCSVVLNFLKFVNELLRTASEWGIAVINLDRTKAEIGVLRASCDR